MGLCEVVIKPPVVYLAEVVSASDYILQLILTFHLPLLMTCTTQAFGGAADFFLALLGEANLGNRELV